MSGSGAESVEVFVAEGALESVKMVDVEGVFCSGSVKRSRFASRVARSEGVNGILSNFFNVALDLTRDPARRRCILNRELEKMERR